MTSIACESQPHVPERRLADPGRAFEHQGGGTRRFDKGLYLSELRLATQYGLDRFFHRQPHSIHRRPSIVSPARR